MESHIKQQHQLELWIELASDLAKVIAQKKEQNITEADVIKMAHKVQDIISVLDGKAKLEGWRYSTLHPPS